MEPNTGEAQLAELLAAMRVRAGWPSARAITDRIRAAGGQASHTTIALMFRSRPYQRHWPTWTIIEATAVALGGDPAELTGAWNTMVHNQRNPDPETAPHLLLARIADNLQRIADTLDRLVPPT
jgi:hypothetical protein